MPSVMPEESLASFKNKLNWGKNEQIPGHKKVYRLEPISNQLSPKNKHKVSICDNNLLAP
jgi:hypothetical protein